MKHISLFLTVVAGLVLAAACKDYGYDVMENQAFILQTSTDAYSSMKMAVGNDPVSKDINVRLSSPAKSDCSFNLVFDASVLEAYNKRNETPYVALPENAFSLSTSKVNVAAGQTVSEPIVLTVNPLTEEMKNSGKQYALAFRLESVSGGAEVLEPGSKITVPLDIVVIQPVVVLSQTVWGKRDLAQGEVDLTNGWTVEFNINKDVLGANIGQYNNQAVFCSPKDEIYVRFGDAPIKGTVLQIKHQGTQMNSVREFAVNTWYHIAFVSSGTSLSLYVNGELDNSMALPGNTVISDKFELNYQPDYNKGNAMFSEVRFWSKARTQKELQNNMYLCDPTSDGLIFYYKCNEGAGNVLKDVSGNNNDLTLNDTPAWVQDVQMN